MSGEAQVDFKKLRYREEGSFGAGAAAGAQTNIRFSTENLRQRENKTESQENTGTQQVPAHHRTRQFVEGTVESELFYGEFDVWMQYALRSSGWSSLVTVTSQGFDASSVDNSINDAGGSFLHAVTVVITNNDLLTRASGSWITDGFRNGMVVTIANAEDPANDGDHTVTTLTALAMTFSAGGLTNNAEDTTIDVSNAGGFITDGIVAGEWNKLSGFTDALNAGWGKVVSVVAAKVIYAGIDLATEAAGDQVVLKIPEQIVGPGTTYTSFALERELTDVAAAQGFREFKGCEIDTMRITINDDEIVTIAFDIMGASENLNTATAGDGSPVSVGTTAAFKTDSDLNFLYEDNASAEGMTFDITLTNGLRHRGEQGTTGPASFGTSRLRVEGNHTTVYKTKTLYAKYLDETLTSYAVNIVDPAGNEYLIEIIQVRIGEADQTGGGVEEDVEMSAPFDGEMDSSESFTIRIAKLAA